MDALLQAREEINAIDGQMAALFEARMAAAAKIAAYKLEKGLPVLDRQRELQVLERNTGRIQDPALRPHYAQVLEAMMAQSRAWQEELLAARRTQETGLHVDEKGSNSEAGEEHREPSPVLPVVVRTPSGTYPVVLRRDALAEAGSLLDLNRRVLIVTDEGVPAEYAKTLAAQCALPLVITVPQGEGSKSPGTWTRLLEAMLKAGFTRKDCVAAVGGGVVGDLAGFVAASYMRGVDFYNLPTTVLSMVDSSVGGKTAVNLDGVKNIVGAFYQPRAVVIDPAVLGTLDQRQRSAGLAEAVKMALSLDAAFFARLEEPELPPIEEIIRRALELKRSVVERDEKEAGLRKVLNLGHSLGHGIEAARTGADPLLHGECVALGMVPMCAPAVRERLLPVLQRLGLPTHADFDREAALAAIAHDKKVGSDGRVEIVTVPEIGAYSFQKASLEELRQLLEEI